LRAAGFSCSLGVLYGGLGISKLQFLIKKIEIKFPAINFFSVLGHQSLDPDPESGSAIRKNAGFGSVSGSALNQCGSETLIPRPPLQDVQVTKEASRKRTSNTSKHEISYFFVLQWVIFALLDPNPDSENGSGSTDLI
jgi:hypothetical protein